MKRQPWAESQKVLIITGGRWTNVRKKKVAGKIPELGAVRKEKSAFGGEALC